MRIKYNLTQSRTQNDQIDCQIKGFLLYDFKDKFCHSRGNQEMSKQLESSKHPRMVYIVKEHAYK